MAQSFGIHHSGNFLCDGVGSHRSVLLVGDEYPLTVFGKIEGGLLLLLGELDTQRVLAHVAPCPTAIATATYLATFYGVDVGPYTSTIHTEGTILNPLFLGVGTVRQGHTNPLRGIPRNTIAKGEVYGWNLVLACGIVGKVLYIYLARTTEGNKTLYHGGFANLFRFFSCLLATVE
jgi:hypothetical protein